MWELCVPIPGPGIDVCSYASPACPFKTGVKETVQVSDLYLDKSFPNVIKGIILSVSLSEHVWYICFQITACHGYWMTLLGKEVGCFSVVLKLVAKQLGL